MFHTLFHLDLEYRYLNYCHAVYVSFLCRFSFFCNFSLAIRMCNLAKLSSLWQIIHIKHDVIYILYSQDPIAYTQFPMTIKSHRKLFNTTPPPPFPFSFLALLVNWWKCFKKYIYKYLNLLHILHYSTQIKKTTFLLIFPGWGGCIQVHPAL